MPSSLYDIDSYFGCANNSNTVNNSSLLLLSSSSTSPPLSSSSSNSLTDPLDDHQRHLRQQQLNHNNNNNNTTAASVLDLALEFGSLLGLNSNNNNNNNNQTSLSNNLNSFASSLHHGLTGSANPLSNTLLNSGGSFGDVSSSIEQNRLLSAASSAAKRSQNTTECVPVPSSEHVAEIVGRQGCKIKALRAKTNTYIKTPVRGEEPVFVVTGRKEDVNAAKREILSAAEHFSQIRAQRKNNPGSAGPAPNAHLPGHITIQVRVPYRVVGLVVGPKGATIKRIQQQTNTYIITPSREKDPVFEVTGLPEDVEIARKEVEAHIAIRTGGLIDSAQNGGSGGGSVGTPEESDFSGGSPPSSSSSLVFSSSLDNPLFFSNSVDRLSLMGASKTKSMYNNSLFDHFSNKLKQQQHSQHTNSSFGQQKSIPTPSSSSYKEFCSIFDNCSMFSMNGNEQAHNTSHGDSRAASSSDEGIGHSPTFDLISTNSAATFSSLWSSNSSSQNINKTLDNAMTISNIAGHNSSNNNDNRSSPSSLFSLDQTQLATPSTTLSTSSSLVSNHNHQFSDSISDLGQLLMFDRNLSRRSSSLDSNTTTTDSTSS